MKQDKGLYYQVTTVAIIAGAIALIGIVVGLYFEFLPERNHLIRYTEIGFSLFCLPFLLRETWLRLNLMRYSNEFLKICLAATSMTLVFFLYLAFIEGGIITAEFMIVVVLLISTLMWASIGVDKMRAPQG